MYMYLGMRELSKPNKLTKMQTILNPFFFFTMQCDNNIY